MNLYVPIFQYLVYKAKEHHTTGTSTFTFLYGPFTRRLLKSIFLMQYGVSDTADMDHDKVTTPDHPDTPLKQELHMPSALHTLLNQDDVVKKLSFMQ